MQKPSGRNYEKKAVQKLYTMNCWQILTSFYGKDNKPVSFVTETRQFFMSWWWQKR